MQENRGKAKGQKSGEREQRKRGEAEDEMKRGVEEERKKGTFRNAMHRRNVILLHSGFFFSEATASRWKCEKLESAGMRLT